MKKKIDLIILCGGRGLRLKKITEKISKPMIKFGNVSFLRHIINFYKKYNFENIYLLAGYKGEQILKEFNESFENSTAIRCFIEKEPLGTGGAIKNIKNKIKNDFVLVNGDSFLNLNFSKFLNFKNNSNFMAKMILVKNLNYKSNRKLSSLSIDVNNTLKFNYKSNLMNSGIYFFKKKSLKYFSKKKFSLENDLLPKLIKQKKIIAYQEKNFFIDIGTKKQLISAKKKLKKYFYKPGLFLDRDGVLNKDTGYVYKYKDFKWLPGSIKAIKFAQSKFHIFIVTNQSGIGRGYYSLEQFNILHKKIKTHLCSKNIFINDLEFCPHHPVQAKGKYKFKCDCRKPNIGMIKNLKKKWYINFKKSIFIGDKKSDQEAAKKSKIKFFYKKKNLFNSIKKYI